MATYYDIRNYEKLRTLFGELLREVQRIKSQGDYAAGKAFGGDLRCEGDPELHKQVLLRAEKTAPCAVRRFHPARNFGPGVDADGKITDVKWSTLRTS